jgi:hypothetical protein
MFVIAAMALTSYFYQPHPPQSTERLYQLAGWRIAVAHDKFTGQVSCSLSARHVRFKSDTLIFHIRPGVETTHAVFRIDGGAPRPVSTVFREDEAHGFFPQRGFIDDPAGGDVALPADEFKGVRRLWIRASPADLPSYFNVRRFDDALAGAKAAGCSDQAFGAAS